LKKYWIYAAAALAVVLSLVLSDSFFQVILHRRTIRIANAEIQSVESLSAEARERLSRLQNDPDAYEQLVRQELGYLRPGEKEARFMKGRSR